MNIDSTADKSNPAPGEPDRADVFMRLYSEHQRELFKFIFTLVPSHADADDILQETSVILWHKFNDFTIGSNFQSWASTIAFNKVRDFRKKAARDRLRFWTDDLVEAIAETRRSESDSLVRQRTLLAGCVRELGERDRELIRHAYGKRISIKDVAEQLGRPSNTVYKALNRIRKALTDCIARRERNEQSGRLS